MLFSFWYLTSLRGTKSHDVSASAASILCTRALVCLFRVSQLYPKLTKKLHFLSIHLHHLSLAVCGLFGAVGLNCCWFEIASFTHPTKHSGAVYATHYRSFFLSKEAVQGWAIHMFRRLNKLFGCPRRKKNFLSVILKWVTSTKQTTVKVKRTHLTSAAGNKSPTVVPAWHRICHRSQKQPWCKKMWDTNCHCVDIMISCTTSRPTRAEISVGVLIFFNLSHCDAE